MRSFGDGAILILIVVSIGGNDLWGGTDWRNAPPRDPDAVMTGVLDRLSQIVAKLREASPTARIFIIGLYNPFISAPQGSMLSPIVTRWNARLAERFAKDILASIPDRPISFEVFSDEINLQTRIVHPPDLAALQFFGWDSTFAIHARPDFD